MRRSVLLLILPLLGAGVLAGCGGSTGTHSASPAVSVSGTFGHPPSVKIPAHAAGKTLTAKTLIHGNGAAFHTGDAFVGNYAIYAWSGASHKLLGSTYTANPATPQLLAGQLLPGLQKALAGQKMGSRVLAVIPPKEGFGTKGNPNAGIKPNDTLVFVVDMISDFPATASASGHQAAAGKGLPTVSAVSGHEPKITIPAAKPPSGLVAKTLIKGTGPAVAKGDLIVVQYTGVNWRTRKVFDASWLHGQPFAFPIGVTPGHVITGWTKGLLGQTVGSRVLLVIPPADGYGKAGSPQAHIKGSDTLVFVVDVLGAFHGNKAS